MKKEFRDTFYSHHIDLLAILIINYLHIYCSPKLAIISLIFAVLFILVMSIYQILFKTTIFLPIFALFNVCYLQTEITMI